MFWWKIGAGAVAVAALATFGWRVSVWHDKAQRLEAAEAALSDERKAHAKSVETFANRVEEFTEAQKLLSGDLAKIGDRFSALKIPTTLVRTVEVPGAPCPAVRLDPAFVRVWNESSSP